jgi:hypothetical protein
LAWFRSRVDAADEMMADAGPCPRIPFTDPRDYQIGMMGLGITATDLDDDGDIDLVTANQGMTISTSISSSPTMAPAE